MEELIYNSKKWKRIVLEKNFYPHERSNGEVIYVSIDSQYFYRKP